MLAKKWMNAKLYNLFYSAPNLETDKSNPSTIYGNKKSPMVATSSETDLTSDKLWNLSGSKKHIRLKMKSFNHIAREVLDLEKSRQFYCNILGFVDDTQKQQ